VVFSDGGRGKKQEIEGGSREYAILRGEDLLGGEYGFEFVEEPKVPLCALAG